MSLSHLILGLLEEQPMTGYDLNKAFEQTAQHFWTTEQSQIYRALYRMEENGWVNVENVIQHENPNKKIYHVTEAGRDELRRWLSRPIATTTLREGWMGQVYFGGQVKNSAVIAVLEAYRDELLRDLEESEAIMTSISAAHDLSKLPRRGQFHLLVLDFGIRAQRDHIRHIQYMIDRIQQFPEEDDHT